MVILGTKNRLTRQFVTKCWLTTEWRQRKRNFVSWKFWSNFEVKTTTTQNILVELITKRSRKVFMLVIEASDNGKCITCAKENETFGPSRKELRCDLKNYNFFFIFRIANNKLIDILEVEKNEKK